MILQTGAFAKKATRKLITVYCKLIKIPLGTARAGIIRQRIINISPEYIKTVTSGDITEVAAIPIGAKVPNNPSETGAVKNCAPVEDARVLAKYPGKKRIYIL